LFTLGNHAYSDKLTEQTYKAKFINFPAFILLQFYNIEIKSLVSFTGD